MIMTSPLTTFAGTAIVNGPPLAFVNPRELIAGAGTVVPVGVTVGTTVGVGVALAAVTENVAAGSVQLYRTAHPGEQTPTPTRYVPTTAFPGTCHVTG